MKKNIITLLFLLLVSCVYAKEKNHVATTVKLTLDETVHTKIQSLAKSMKNKFEAKGVSIAVMDSKSGDILALADSNNDILKDFPNNSIASFSYEPGFVCAPIVFALAVDKKHITPNDLINGYKGEYKIAGKIVRDHYPFDYLSASSVIIHSSNIGMAQIAQKLSAREYHNGLYTFGLTKRAVDWFANEQKGYIPDERHLQNDIYKVTASYGYGVRVNLLQLLRAYNVFNNDGLLVKLKIFANIKSESPTTVLDANSAHTIKQILIKTVEKGTGKNAKINGIEIGGKTGTAHIVENGRYVKKYNHTFVGFANKGDEQHYTIAVLVKEPQTSQYAYETAAVIFKKVVFALTK